MSRICKMFLAASVLSTGIVALAPRTALGQGLTAEDVTAVMESESVKGAFEGCAASFPHPESVDFVFIVGADGLASLSKTDPPVDADLFLCFQKAAKNIAFQGSGKKFEITYPMEFAPYTGAPAPVPQPPPTPQPAPTAVPAGTATGAAAAAGAGGGQATETREGWADPRWEREYRVGRGLLIAGAVMLGVGGAAFLGSIFAWIPYGLTCGIANAFDEDAECYVPKAIPIVLFTGLAVLVTGIVLLAVGAKKKNRAARMRYGFLIPEPGLSPLADTDGALASLTWRF